MLPPIALFFSGNGGVGEGGWGLGLGGTQVFSYKVKVIKKGDRKVLGWVAKDKFGFGCEAANGDISEATGLKESGCESNLVVMP